MWLVDSSPPGDIAGNEEAALDAGENILSKMVMLISATAYTAHPAGVPWINQRRLHAHQSCPVGDFAARIIERPGAMLSPLTLANRHPFADTLRVFQDHPAPGVFGLLNATPGDAMIHVLGKSSLVS